MNTFNQKSYKSPLLSICALLFSIITLGIYFFPDMSFFKMLLPVAFLFSLTLDIAALKFSSKKIAIASIFVLLILVVFSVKSILYIYMPIPDAIADL